MPRIAVIQDGTEVARQRFADVIGEFEKCRTLLSADGNTFSLSVFIDDEVESLINDINRFDCLVFASNALLSSSVSSILEGRQADLHRYLEAGRGVVILHQLCDSLDPLLPTGSRIPLHDRLSLKYRAEIRQYVSDDVLLHYPFDASAKALDDGPHRSGLDPLFFKALPVDLPEQFGPVLMTADGQVLLARSHDHTGWRIVVTTIPLDWHGYVELLANAVRYAALGKPRRLVWRDDTSEAQSQLLLRWLCMDGSSSVRALPTTESISITDKWLLSTVELLVIPPSAIDAVEQRQEVAAFLRHGGTLVTAGYPATMAFRVGEPARPPDAPSRIAAVVGGHTERVLASSLYSELRSVDGWMTARYAFELRNIVIALAFLRAQQLDHSPGAYEPSELQALVPEIRKKLQSENDREDLGSSIALLQALAYLEAPDPVPVELWSWMPDRSRRFPPDVRLQVQAAVALASRRPDLAILDDACRALGELSPLTSLAPVVRVLDAVGVLDQAGFLVNDPDATSRLATLAVSALDAVSGQATVRWLSVEATVDVVRGLVALLDRLEPADRELRSRATDYIGAGVTTLRIASSRYERNAKGVAWLARVTHGVVLVECRFPIGLQRLASLDWPDRTTDHIDRSLLDHLALENKHLRRTERRLNDQRLSASIGRAVVTSVTVTLLIGAAVVLLRAIGSDSSWALIGNTTVAAGVTLTILAALFGELDRRHLLAAPAGRVLSWVTDHILPLMSALANMKPKTRGDDGGGAR